MDSDKRLSPIVRPTDEELKVLSDSFEAKQPWDVLEHAFKTYKERIVLACSLGRKMSR